MRTLHANQETERQKSGRRLNFFLKIYLSNATLYLSEYTVTISGQQWLGRISSVGDLSQQVTPSGFVSQWLSSRFNINCLNLYEDAARLEDYEESTAFEGSVVEVYWAFMHSAITSAELNLWATMVIERAIFSTEMVTFELIDPVLAVTDKTIGRQITVETFPDSPPSSRGLVLPTIFGRSKNVPLIPVDIGKRGVTDGSSLIGDMSIRLREVSTDPTDETAFGTLAVPFSVYIETEEISVASVDVSGRYLNLATPLIENHTDGAAVHEKKALYTFAAGGLAQVGGLVSDGGRYLVRSDGQLITDVTINQGWDSTKEYHYVTLDGIPMHTTESGTLEVVEYSPDFGFNADLSAFSEKAEDVGGGYVGNFKVHPNSSCAVLDGPNGVPTFADKGAIDTDNDQGIALLRSDLSVDGRAGRSLRLRTGGLANTVKWGGLSRVRLCFEYSANPKKPSTQLGKWLWDWNMPIVMHRDAVNLASGGNASDLTPIATLRPPLTALADAGAQEVTDLEIHHGYDGDTNRGTTGLFYPLDPNAGRTVEDPQTLLIETNANGHFWYAALGTIYFHSNGAVARNVQGSLQDYIASLDLPTDISAAIDGNASTYLSYGVISEITNASLAGNNTSQGRGLICVLPYKLATTEFVGIKKFRVEGVFKGDITNFSRLTDGSIAQYYNTRLSVGIAIGNPNTWTGWQWIGAGFGTGWSTYNATIANYLQVAFNGTVVPNSQFIAGLENGQYNVYVALSLNEEFLRSQAGFPFSARQYYTAFDVFDLKVYAERLIPETVLKGTMSDLQSAIDPFAVWSSASTFKSIQKVDITDFVTDAGGPQTFFESDLDIELDFNNANAGETLEVYVNRCWIEIERRPMVSQRYLGDVTADLDGILDGTVLDDPAEILEYVLTSPQFAGIAAGQIDAASISTLSTALAAAGFVASRAYTSEFTLDQLITELVVSGGMRLFQSEGLYTVAAIVKNEMVESADASITKWMDTDIEKIGPPISQLANLVTVRYGWDWAESLAQREVSREDKSSQGMAWGTRQRKVDAIFLSQAATAGAANLAELFLARNATKRQVIALETDLTYLHLEIGDLIDLSDTRNKLDQRGEIVQMGFGSRQDTLNFGISVKYSAPTVFWACPSYPTTRLAVSGSGNSWLVYILGDLVARLEMKGDLFLKGGLLESPTTGTFPSQSNFIVCDGSGTSITIGFNAGGWGAHGDDFRGFLKFDQNGDLTLEGRTKMQSYADFPDIQVNPTYQQGGNDAIDTWPNTDPPTHMYTMAYLQEVACIVGTVFPTVSPATAPSDFYGGQGYIWIRRRYSNAL